MCVCTITRANARNAGDDVCFVMFELSCLLLCKPVEGTHNTHTQTTLVVWLVVSVEAISYSVEVPAAKSSSLLDYSAISN